MPIEVQTDVDYEAICDELGVTIDELLTLVKNKDKLLSPSSSDVPAFEVINEFTENIKWLQSLNRRSTETTITYVNFLIRLKENILEKYPDLLISEINEDIIYGFLSNGTPKKGDQLSINTVNKYMAIVRSLLRFSFERGYTQKDLRYKFPIKHITTLPRYLNDEQIEYVLQAALQKTNGYRKRAMLYFLLGTGCRVSELTNMKVCDFNVDEGLIFVKGKGNKERYIPMYDEVRDATLRYLRMSGVPKWDFKLKGYLFSKDYGLVREKPILNRSVEYLVRGIFDKANIGRDFTVHSFRHTFAVNCLKAGMSQRYLMQILGHEDPQTTAIYTQLLPHDLKDEVMKHYPFPFEALLNDLI